jgi:phosphatidylinositol alpha-1,6-mannosyltransferase
VQEAASELGSFRSFMRLWIVTRVALAHGLSGGMERHAELLATGLSARGHRVNVVTTAHPDGRTTDRIGDVDVVYVPGTTWRRDEPQWWAETYERLRAAHADEPVDAVVSLASGALGWLARARADLGVPTVVVLHGSLRGELRRTRSGARTVRGWSRLARTVWRSVPLLVRWRRAAGAVARWAPVTEAVAAGASPELGVPPDRMTVVPPGVDVERFRPDPMVGEAWRAASGLSADDRVLALVAPLEPATGVAVAVEALALLDTRLDDVVLLIAGAGADSAALRRRARALGVGSQVRFLGPVGHDELAAVLAAADLFVLPALDEEGLPLSALEASTAGLPVVASDVPGVREAVVDGVTGVLVPPGSADALAGAVEELLSDTARRRELGKQGRVHAEQRFSQAVVCEAVEKLLMEVGGRPGGQDRP